MDSGFISQLGWVLVHFVWEGIAVGLVIGFLLWLLRNKSPEARYVCACGGLIALLACPIVTFLALKGPSSDNALPIVARVAIPHEFGLGQLHTVGSRFAFSSQHPHERIAAMDVAWQDTNQTSDPVRASRALTSIMPALVGLWACGVVVLALRMLGGLLMIERIRRRMCSAAPEEWQSRLNTLALRLGMNRPVRLLLCDRVAVPSTSGFVKACILLPSAMLLKLTPDQLESVLLHELAHVRRFDYLANVMQICIETLLFYHPIVWWVSSVARTERENCCDDIAARAVGDPLVYARALACLEENLVSRPLPVIAANGGNLMKRISRLTQTVSAPTPISPLWLAAAMLTMGGLVFGSTLQLQSKTARAMVHVGPKKARPHQVKTFGLTASSTKKVGRSATIYGLTAETHLPAELRQAQQDGAVAGEPIKTMSGSADSEQFVLIRPGQTVAGWKVVSVQHNRATLSRVVKGLRVQKVLPVQPDQSTRLHAWVADVSSLGHTPRHVLQAATLVAETPRRELFVTPPPSLSLTGRVHTQSTAMTETPGLSHRPTDNGSSVNSVPSKQGFVDVFATNADFVAFVRLVAKHADLSVIVAPGQYEPLNLVLSHVSGDTAIREMSAIANAQVQFYGGIYRITPTPRRPENDAERVLWQNDYKTIERYAFDGIPFKQAVRDLAEDAPDIKSVVFEPGQYTKITARGHNLTFEEALRNLTLEQGATYRIENGVVIVSRKSQGMGGGG